MKPISKPLLRLSFKLGFVVFSLWLIGLFVFAISKTNQEMPEPKEKLDGIIVLTGGSGRLETGLTLLQEGAADRLLLSGVHQSVTPETLAKVSGFSSDVFGCCVDLDYQSESTIDNASAAAQWVRNNSYVSVYLVTSDYHMPRSLVLLQAAMPDILIVPHPVEADISPEGLVIEYNKYLITLIGGTVTGRP